MDLGPKRRISAAAVRETVGLIGIIGSLVFVGLQIRQSTAVARGQTRQELTGLTQEWLMLMSTDSVFRTAFSKAWFEPSDSLTDNEESIAIWGMRMMMRRLENVYLQYREGLVDESALTNYGFQSTAFRSERFREFWARDRNTDDPDFVRYFESKFDVVSH